MTTAADPTPPLEIRQIVAIVQLAHLRSHGLAAEAMNTTQPTLTRMIQKAERDLGMQLFLRGWSGTDLTSEGESIIRNLKNILDALDAAEDTVFDAGKPHPSLRTTLRLRQLQAIAAVIRCGGASMAAKEMGCSQPDISRTISQTASHLGVTLFRRTRSGMEPLPPALAFARLYDAVRFELQQIPHQLTRNQGQLGGRVAVGMLPFSGQELISRAFAALSNRHPHVRLVCVPGSFNSLVDALRRREIDLMVGVLRGQALASDLRETHLYHERFTIIARRDHPMQHTARSIADLDMTQWVVAPHGTPVRSYFEALFARIGATPPIQTCEMLSFASAEQMLVESNSVGMLTYSDARLAQLRPDLHRLDIDLPDAKAQVGLIRLAQQDDTPALRAFEATLRALVPQPETRPQARI